MAVSLLTYLDCLGITFDGQSTTAAKLGWSNVSIPLFPPAIFEERVVERIIVHWVRA